MCGYTGTSENVGASESELARWMSAAVYSSRSTSEVRSMPFGEERERERKREKRREKEEVWFWRIKQKMLAMIFILFVGFSNVKRNFLLCCLNFTKLMHLPKL